MMEQKFNGWTNYETWAVALWIDNEQASYNYWRDQAEHHRYMASESEAMAHQGVSPQEEARRTLAGQLKEEITDASPLSDATLYADLLQSALGEVDWYEIADHLVGDVEERIAADATSATTAARRRAK